ncbi:unnamed protein product, partial [Meganyctiphanes norvegica]
MNKRYFFILLTTVVAAFLIYFGDAINKFDIENNIIYTLKINHKEELPYTYKGVQHNSITVGGNDPIVYTTHFNSSFELHTSPTTSVNSLHVNEREHTKASVSQHQTKVNKSVNIIVPDLPRGFCSPVVPAKHIAYHQHTTPYHQKPENNHVINPRPQKRTILNYEKVVRKETPVVWPIIYFHTDGRLGNCLNVYATALAMANRYNATFVTGDYEYRMLLKLLEPAALQLYIINKQFVDAVKNSSSIAWSGRAWTSFDAWVDYEQAIVNAIREHRENGIKQLMPFIGYPNRMHLLGRHMNLVRENFLVRADLREKTLHYLITEMFSIKAYKAKLILFYKRSREDVKVCKNMNTIRERERSYNFIILGHYGQNTFYSTVCNKDSVKLVKICMYVHTGDETFSGMNDLKTKISCVINTLPVGFFSWWN